MTAGTGSSEEQKKSYWESLQDAAKIDDYIGWGIGAIIIVPLIILFVPMGLNVSWDDSSGRLAAVLLGWGVVSSIITTIIASFNCVLWGTSSVYNDQCCRVGKPKGTLHDEAKGDSGCGTENKNDIRIGKLLMYLLPIIFSGMLFASMIISVNRGDNAGHSFLVFFIPAMIVLTHQIQGFYLRIQERNAKEGINSLVKENYNYTNDSAVMTRYAGYSTILIWLLTLGIMFAQTLFGKMIPQWASGYKMIAWIIFTILLIFFSLVETTVSNVGENLAPVVDPIMCLFGKKDITGNDCPTD